MTPEPWKPLARFTHQAEWTTCLACGKRYLVRLPPPAQRTLKDLHDALKGKHTCRTERQTAALRDYEELEL